MQSRKNQMAALLAAQEVGLPLVVVGPEKDPAVARELRAKGATLRGYVPLDELVALYTGAACVVQSSRYEGFGLPVLEAMACGVPVVTVPDPALLEVVGDAAVVVEEEPSGGRYPPGRLRARAARGRPGSSAPRSYSWRAVAEQTVAVYQEAIRPMSVSAVVVSHGHADVLDRSLPLLAAQVDEVVVVANLPGSTERAAGGNEGDREPASRSASPRT